MGDVILMSGDVHKKNILENYVCKSKIWTQKQMTLIPQVAPLGQQFQVLDIKQNIIQFRSLKTDNNQPSKQN